MSSGTKTSNADNSVAIVGAGALGLVATKNLIEEGFQFQEFQRLIMANGSNNKAHVPQVKGIEKFEGEVMHSQALKDPSRYEGKTILVVGISNSAADSIQFLAGAGAAKLYVSHRRKFVTLPRVTHGKGLDSYLSLRNQYIGSWIQWLAPSFLAWLSTKFLEILQYRNFPKLRNHACQSDRHFPPHGQFVPVISENLATNLTEGRVQSVNAIEEVIGPGRVKLSDGEELEKIDVILFCTGLHPNLAIMLPPSADPYNPAHAPEIFATLPPDYVKNRRVCRAYRGFLSLQHPHSLAFLGAILALRSAFPLYDLVTMALAQLWSGKSPMPTREAMQENTDGHLKLLANTMRMHGEVQHAGAIDQFAMDAWLHQVAGTGLLSSVGIFSWKAWALYLTEPELYKALLDGPPTAHAFRLFETESRRAWPGAKSAILKAYADSKEPGRQFEKK
ncbi:hypothetical protein PRZ48_011039 [Zasmidium cellare]|uniref:Flavin-containing monooxygenase n=1 Tax=Zasmidium cellare TaxID=395010 RepID=A0ABR0EAW0_ZASCE|nr:hypothetical protein PRZ48_011039 [Zasmidium cellare]